MKILVIIPARSGSKGVPHKNIRDLNGKPLLAWSIFHAQQSKYSEYMKIIVSTDSEEYATVARTYGAEVPFLRPRDISQDDSADIECIEHAVCWLKEHENYESDIILHLRPTQPCRNIEDVNESIDVFWKVRKEYDSLRSVIPVDKSPYKMYRIQEDTKELIPLFQTVNNIREPYNQGRQQLPVCYVHNGYIDILNTSILKEHTISGKKIYPYLMKETENIDIDTEADWVKTDKYEH